MGTTYYMYLYNIFDRLSLVPVIIKPKSIGRTKQNTIVVYVVFQYSCEDYKASIMGVVWFRQRFIDTKHKYDKLNFNQKTATKNDAELLTRYLGRKHV